MTTPLLSRRERLIWLAAFLLVAALLVLTRFESHDADSVRYATLSSVLSTLPIERLIVPEWWGLSADNPLTGYFQEHPAGLFVIPALLGKMGVPRDQAPYMFGVAVGLAALLLLGHLVARLSTREQGRAVLVLLQFMPMAFVFRVRDNHEYPMLVCLLATIIGLAGLGRSWRAIVLVIAGIVGGLLIKGVFVAQVLLGAGIWILLNPTGASRVRMILACVAACAAMVVVGVGYDAWYAAVTGEPFWKAYWARQLGPLEVATPLNQAWDFTQHLFFYVGRLLFHPAPWSFALVWALVARRRLERLTTDERSGFWFVALFTVSSVFVLSFAGRFAERYAFSASYLVGTAGAAAAYRYWPRLRLALDRMDSRVPALPAIVWTVLVSLRLLLGPWLPRMN